MSEDKPVDMIITREPILTREEIGELIDNLPESELHSVKRYLQFMHYLDDPETLGRVETQAVAEGLKPIGKPKKKRAVAPVTADELKELLGGIEEYRLTPAGWFIRFTHATSGKSSGRAGQITPETLTRKGKDQ